jgi:hypothetical protein
MAMMPIALATGPEREAWIVASGASHGIAVPLLEAQAGLARRRVTPAASRAVWDLAYRRAAALAIKRGNFIFKSLLPKDAPRSWATLGLSSGSPYVKHLF